jgi:predicted aconitase with swiveling domain
MPRTTLKGRTIVEGNCTAEALVSAKPISFLGGVDPADGKIIQKNHDLCGQCVKSKILCFPHGHGSTVGSYVLYSLTRRNLAPKAIVNEKADPVVVVGAIIADITMIDQVDIGRIRTGDLVQVDGAKGTVTILKRRGTQACT